MDEQKDLTPEPGFLQDWNFIYLRDHNVIFDITWGIEYQYQDENEIQELYIYRIGSAEKLDSQPRYVGDMAKEFWRQLKARVEMDIE